MGSSHSEMPLISLNTVLQLMAVQALDTQGSAEQERQSQNNHINNHSITTVTRTAKATAKKS